MTVLNQFDRRSLILASLLAVALVVVCGLIGLYVFSSPDIMLVHQFAATFAQVESAYAESVDHEALIKSARQGMFDRLDRYSFYIPPVNMDRMREESTGSYAGIGVTIVRHNGGFLIVSVRAEGPAQTAGLLIGDIILADSATVGLEQDPNDLLNLLRGQPGDSLTIHVYRRAMNDTLEISLPRQKVKLEHLPFAGITSDNKLYLKLEDFETGASDDVKAAIDSLLVENDNPPDGIIFDLRGNPGGRLAEAFLTADIFLDEDRLIVGTTGRSRWTDQESYSTGEDRTGGLPIVILVDNASASAAEIVAGALKQHGRAVLVGDTTFGKGLVQGYSSFPDGSGMRLTISRYYLEGRLYLNQFDSTFSEIGAGLVPDHWYKFDSDRRFIRFLENSFLFFDFAAIHNDSLVDQTKDGTIGNRWLNRFADFAISEGFIYTSESTTEAKRLVDLAANQENSKPLLKGANDLLIKAQKLDIDLLIEHGDFIKRRLTEIAWQRKFGTYQAWSRITIRNRPDIDYAAKVMENRPK